MSISGNMFHQCHFQPADDMETYFLYSDGSNDTYADCAFWDSGRPSNKVQIVLNGNYNRITGHVPAKSSGYVQDNGSYNYFLGSSYSSNALEAPFYYSDRGYYQRYKQSGEKTVTCIAALNYDSNHKELNSIANENLIIYEYPIDLSVLREGHTIIEIETFGLGSEITCDRHFYVHANNEYVTYTSHKNKWARTFTSKLLLQVRKYKGYSDINYFIESKADGDVFINFVKKRYYENDKTIKIKYSCVSSENKGFQVKGTIVNLTPAL